MRAAGTPSLQSQLLAFVLGVLLLVWTATALLTWRDVRHELDELLDSHLAQAAALLVAQQAQGAHDSDDDERSIDAPLLHRYATKTSFQVFHEGRLALRSANAPQQPMAPPGAAHVTGFRTVTLDGRAWRVFTAVGAERDVLVYVGEQLHSREDILWAALRSTLWPMLAAVPLLALGVWWAVRRGTTPLRRLARALATRRGDDLAPVEIGHAPAEMRGTLDSLNGLLRRIAQLLQSERRFTADAAHELRTPIAAIRAQAQVASAARDEAERRHALAATIEGCGRATRVVEQLLTLSQLESGSAPALHAVDLAAVTREVLAQLAPAAIARRQSLDLEAPAPAWVRGDETLLSLLVRNLVDNALRYSPDGAPVRVSVHTGQDARVVLAVEDRGPGLPDADLARLGERFFRALGTRASGSGLGWSIVQRIGALHEADVRAGRCEGGGLAVGVAFPPGA